ncbi:MAG TPA: hypothetical protein VGR92_07020 [Steroidobacteraceae bacterium]|nr:hypothetical protein [Steroidobacteraceae bacterium]
MASCGFCGSTILFGGLRAGNQRFCDRKCAQKAAVAEAVRRLPGDAIEQAIAQIRRSNCPKCGGLGPLDARQYYKVWSALFMTRWSSATQVSCNSCATRRSLGAIAYCLLLGWWGFPWGLVMTPAQISRNIRAMRERSTDSQPSRALRNFAMTQLGARMASNAAADGSGAIGAPAIHPGR